MVDTIITTGTSRTTRLDMSGTDTLTLQVNATFSVSANAQTVRFNGATTDGQITNSGTIQNTAAGGRAIRVETSVGSTFTATITNNAGGTISANDDAIQIQSAAAGGPNVTSGKSTISNLGTITSTSGQALDLAGGGGTSVQSVTNTAFAQITAADNDAIRLGGVATLINNGTINGGTNAAYTIGGDGVQIETGSTAIITNAANGIQAGDISGDRHGINASIGTTITVTNNVGGTITGRNGSGIGSDGTTATAATIVNRGTITGAFNSAAADINGSTVNQPNGGAPDGVVDGDGDGVDVDGFATIDNYGSSRAPARAAPVATDGPTPPRALRPADCRS